MATTRDRGSLPGDPHRRQLQALLRLASEVYPQLCRLARQRLRDDPSGVIGHPVGLVHEALLRIDPRRPPRSSGHLLGMTAHLMRRVLIDQARRRSSWKRYAAVYGVVARSAEHGADGPALDDESLARALTALEARHPRAARVAELRYLQGLSVARTARALGVSPRTVNADWSTARAWLARALSDAR